MKLSRIFLISISVLLYGSCASYHIREKADMDKVSAKITQEKKDLWQYVETALRNPPPEKEPRLHYYILRSLAEIPHENSRIILKRYFSDADAEKRGIAVSSYYNHRKYYDEVTIREDVQMAIEQNLSMYSTLTPPEREILLNINSYDTVFTLCRYASSVEDLTIRDEILTGIKGLDKSAWEDDRVNLVRKCLEERIIDSFSTPQTAEAIESREPVWDLFLSVSPDTNPNLLLSMTRAKSNPILMRKECLLKMAAYSTEAAVVSSEYRKLKKEEIAFEDNNDSVYSGALDATLAPLVAARFVPPARKNIPGVKSHANEGAGSPSMPVFPGRNRPPSVKYRNQLNAFFIRSAIPSSVLSKMENNAIGWDPSGLRYTTFTVLYPGKSYHSIKNVQSNAFHHPYFFTTFMYLLRQKYPARDLQAAYLANLWNLQLREANALILLYEQQGHRLIQAGL